jgi:hypothetical protein
VAVLLTAEEDELFNFLLGSAAPQVLDAVTSGSTPDLVALDRLAAALDRLRRGIAEGRLQCSVEPSEADVEAARRLVDLARAGAPKDELTAAACVVHRILNRPLDSAHKRPREEHEREILDRLRARGVDPTDADMTDVRRLAALQVEDADDAIDVATESQEITRRLFRLTDS